MSKKEEKEKSIEVIAGEQLLSDLIDLAKGRIDVRRLTKISDLQIADMSLLLTIPRHRGGDLIRKIIYNDLNLSMSEAGWRSNLIVRFIAGSKGTTSVLGDIAKKPGWVGRHITDRDWEKKAEEEGKVVVK